MPFDRPGLERYFDPKHCNTCWWRRLLANEFRSALCECQNCTSKIDRWVHFWNESPAQFLAKTVPVFRSTFCTFACTDRTRRCAPFPGTHRSDNIQSWGFDLLRRWSFWQLWKENICRKLFRNFFEIFLAIWWMERNSFVHKRRTNLKNLSDALVRTHFTLHTQTYGQKISQWKYRNENYFINFHGFCWSHVGSKSGRWIEFYSWMNNAES